MNKATHAVDTDEDWVELPLERIKPEILRMMVEEFVTREWSELADSSYTLADKVDQVLVQMAGKRARVVYDMVTKTWNIVPCR